MRVMALAVLFGACATPTQPVIAPAPAPMTIPANGWSPQQRAHHLLNRAAFGPSPSDLAELEHVGEAAWLTAQLDPSGHDAQLEAKLSGFKTLPLTVAQAFAAYPPPQQRLKELGITPDELKDNPELRKQLMRENADELPRNLLIEATQAKLIRSIESRRQLEEVLVDFWFNHFNVSAEKNRTRWMISAYERDAIRPFVLGKFRELLGATAKHPAMLWYLDNWMSVRDGFEVPRRRRGGQLPRRMPTGLNENYARELLELHTVGVNAGYDQDDVREAARALTGWSIRVRPRDGEFGTFIFQSIAHDSGPKEIFGLELAAGGGIEDGEKLLDYLARHPATARHIARKLCVRFVSDEPPQALIDEVAATFVRTDGDLRETTKAIFTSPHFWSDEARAAKTKAPLEFVASSVRAIGTLNEVRQPLARVLDQMGEPLYRCNPPTGFAEHATPWVSAGALVNRINFGLALASGRVPGVSVTLPAAGANSAETLDRVSAVLLGRPLSEGTRGTILKALAGEEADGEMRAIAPAKVAGLLIGSPEFQHQ
ncbi:MAG: DUF1800 domain-containing protein [Archangium sp.]|nr:DUF1800 domain-containing protein [Archangium sp.]